MVGSGVCLSFSRQPFLAVPWQKEGKAEGEVMEIPAGQEPNKIEKKGRLSEKFFIHMSVLVYL